MRQSALTALQNLLSKTAHRMAQTKMQELQCEARKMKRDRFSITETFSSLYNGFWNLLAGAIGTTFNIKECRDWAFYDAVDVT